MDHDNTNGIQQLMQIDKQQWDMSVLANLLELEILRQWVEDWKKLEMIL